MIIYRDILVCILVPKGLELSDDICPAFQMVSDNFSALTSDNVFELDKFYVVMGNKFVLYSLCRVCCRERPALYESHYEIGANLNSLVVRDCAMCIYYHQLLNTLEFN